MRSQICRIQCGMHICNLQLHSARVSQSDQIKGLRCFIGTLVTISHWVETIEPSCHLQNHAFVLSKSQPLNLSTIMVTVVWTLAVKWGYLSGGFVYVVVSIRRGCPRRQICYHAVPMVLWRSGIELRSERSAMFYPFTPEVRFRISRRRHTGSCEYGHQLKLE